MNLRYFYKEKRRISKEWIFAFNYKMNNYLFLFFQIHY